MRNILGYFRREGDSEGIPLLERNRDEKKSSMEDKQVFDKLESINTWLLRRDCWARTSMAMKTYGVMATVTSLLAGGGGYFLRVLGSMIKQRTASENQELIKFYQQPINGSTCHELYPDINPGDYCDKVASILQLCADIITSYCEFRQDKNNSILFTIFLSMGEALLVGFTIFSGYYLYKEYKNGKGRNLIGDLLTQEEKNFLSQQGISTNQNLFWGTKSINNKLIDLTIGSRPLCLLFANEVKGYIHSEPVADNHPDYDAYEVCQRFPTV